MCRYIIRSRGATITFKMNEMKYFFICMSYVGFCVLEQIMWRINPSGAVKHLNLCKWKNTFQRNK